MRRREETNRLEKSKEIRWREEKINRRGNKRKQAEETGRKEERREEGTSR